MKSLDRRRRHKGNVTLIAQAILVVIGVLALTTATYRYFSTRDPDSKPAVVSTPRTGPVGMRPFFSVIGLPENRTVRIEICKGASCAVVASGRSPGPIRSDALPMAIGQTPVEPGTYALRARLTGGSSVVKGNIEVTKFTVGARPSKPAPFDPSAELGAPNEIAAHSGCRPQAAPDGRIIVGFSLIDALRGVTYQRPAIGLEPAWSPKGDRLAFLTGDRKEVRVASPDGSEPEVVVREPRGLISSLSWSPEGDRLAFIASPDVRGGPRGPTVEIVNLVDGARAQFGPGDSVAWAPNSDRMAISRGPTVELSDGSGKRSVLANGTAGVWTADGTHVVLIRGQSAWAVNVDSKAEKQILASGACGVGFTPEGHNLLIADPDGKLVLRGFRR